jgi:hypothetical protein
MAKQTIPTSGLWSSIVALFNSNFDELYGAFGWAQYADTQYTVGSPLSVAADTDTVLPNNALNNIDSQKPTDVDTFYDGTIITGRSGDGIAITVDMLAKPTNTNTSYIEIWFDIGSGQDLYKRIITFPKGNGVERPINFSVSGYTLGTWEANGATVYVKADNTVDLYDIRYVITRTSKAKAV